MDEFRGGGGVMGVIETTRSAACPKRCRFRRRRNMIARSAAVGVLMLPVVGSTVDIPSSVSDMGSRLYFTPTQGDIGGGTTL